MMTSEDLASCVCMGKLWTTYDVNQFKGATLRWWNTLGKAISPNKPLQITWVEFLVHFKLKFCLAQSMLELKEWPGEKVWEVWNETLCKCVSDVTCSKCGKVGHNSTKCATLNIVCYDCGETGHYRRDCPKKGGTLEKNEKGKSKAQLHYITLE